jgi:hypothetical protein
MQGGEGQTFRQSVFSSTSICNIVTIHNSNIRIIYMSVLYLYSYGIRVNYNELIMVSERPKLRKVFMRSGTRNAWSLNRTDSLITVESQIAKCKFDFVGVQVRWGREGTEPAGDYTFFLCTR